MPRTYTIDRSLAGVDAFGGELLLKTKMHATKDAVSETVAQEHELARVRPGSELSCKCGDGECSGAQCDLVRAHDENGVHFASFHGLGLHARQLSDGSTSIYRLPSTAKQTQDARVDDGAIGRMNARNSEFWNSPPEPTERPCRTYVNQEFFWQKRPE
jgi:hypothetical protein